VSRTLSLSTVCTFFSSIYFLSYLLSSVKCNNYINVAADRDATMSSFDSGQTADLAVDSNSLSCALTQSNKEEYWVVDLGETKTVTGLHINMGIPSAIALVYQTLT
jgi:hypothetical protein